MPISSDAPQTEAERSDDGDRKRSPSRAELAFLPATLEVLETPPRPLARVIAITISAFFLVALLWAIFGQIDTVAVAVGRVVPSERSKVVQPLEDGIVRTIHVRDGAVVKQGERLIELDVTDPEAAAAAVEADLGKARLEVAITTALVENRRNLDPAIVGDASPIHVEAARSQLQGEWAKLSASLTAVDAQISAEMAALRNIEGALVRAQKRQPLVVARFKTPTELAEKKLVRRAELQEAHERQIENEAEVISGQSGVAEAKARIASLEERKSEVTATTRADALRRRAEALRQVAGLEQRLRRERQRSADRILRAPVDGIVFDLAVHTVGGVVTTKDILLRIVPANAKLEVEATILNKDIGFVEEGQAVELKLDTFPFTRYGLVDGRVRQIWHDAIQDDQRGLVYKTTIAMYADRVLVGRKWVQITPGMSVRAEVKTGTRSVISFFLSPFLRYRDESLRER